MSVITQFLNQIRNSIYGRDMRSAIYYGIAEAFGQNGTYTDQFICTGGTLTENKTKVKFFIPLHNATKRDITIVPNGIVIRGGGWYAIEPSVTYTYTYQLNGINVVATTDDALSAGHNGSAVSVEFSYDITLG
jgi:hypothetical protein